MNDKHENFDAEKLNFRKDHHSGYQYCPFCGGELKDERLDGRMRLSCAAPGCDFIFYQNPIPAAGAVIVQNDWVLMVQRAHPPRIGWWCLPAGFMEWHEHPSQTAEREILEETGLEIELNGIFEIYSGTDDPRNNAVLILYLANVIGGELKAADDALDVAWFSFNNLPEKIAFDSHIQALADYRERFR